MQHFIIIIIINFNDLIIMHILKILLSELCRPYHSRVANKLFHD